MERYVFVANETNLNVDESIRVNMQIVLENSYRIKVKVVEVLSEEDEALIPLVLNALNDQPLIQAEALLLTNRNLELANVQIENKPLKSVGECLVVVAKNLLENPEEACTIIPQENGYLLSREPLNANIVAPSKSNLQILTIHKTQTELLVLLRTVPLTTSPTPSIEITEDTAWLPNLQQLLRNEKNIIIYSQNNSTTGILGLANCIRKETVGDVCRCVLIQDEHAPTFNTTVDYYKKQLKKGFAINVLKNGKWGTYRHLLLKEEFLETKQHSMVEFATKGDLSSVKWVEGPLNQLDLNEKFVEVIVYKFYDDF